MHVQVCQGLASILSGRLFQHPKPCSLLFVGQYLSKQNRFVFAVVVGHVTVVVVCGKCVGPHRLWAKGQGSVIEIEQVGVVLVDEIDCAIVKFVAIGFRWH